MFQQREASYQVNMEEEIAFSWLLPQVLRVSSLYIYFSKEREPVFFYTQQFPSITLTAWPNKPAMKSQGFYVNVNSPELSSNISAVGWEDVLGVF